MCEKKQGYVDEVMRLVVGDVMRVVENEVRRGVVVVVSNREVEEEEVEEGRGTE